MTDWILEKVRESDVYAQHLYAAMCNNEFQKNMETFKSEEAKAILCAIASQDDMTAPYSVLPKNDPLKTRDINHPKTARPDVINADMHIKMIW
mgnify:CR=1 FL=1